MAAPGHAGLGRREKVAAGDLAARLRGGARLNGGAAAVEPRAFPPVPSPVPRPPRATAGFCVGMPNAAEFPPDLRELPPSSWCSLKALTELDWRAACQGPPGQQRRPLLPPIPAGVGGPGHERLTVVLDLDETLAHCRLEPARGLRHAFAVEFEETGARGFVYPRPCVGLFLEAAARLFEVVVFTASSQRYADQVLDGLDPSGGRISARLYRHHCTEVGHGYFKDLRRLGRALDRTVLVDNSPLSLAPCPDHGIVVSNWTAEDEDDRELMELLLVLQRIAQHGSVPGFLSSRYGLRAFVERLRREPGLLGEPPDGG